ncbi:MAG: hypothetical protein IJR33_08615 [Clostridia bacterium]|nr:hypothetical protein [Clostridia bacterium]
MNNNSLSEKFINTDIVCVSVGCLSNEVVNILKEKVPAVADKIKKRTIVFWRDRIEHIRKHRNDASKLSTNEMVDLVPDVVMNPDYVGAKNDNSITLIKCYNEHVLVAVRVSDKGALAFRTIYTVTEGQVNDYLAKNRLWKVTVDNK